MTLQNLLPANWQFDTTQLNPIDSDGKWLLPPLVDLCARLREPGHQSHGTLKSEGAAATMMTWWSWMALMSLSACWLTGKSSLR